jgi:hypothetical protein
VSKEPVGSVGEEAAKLFAVLQQAAADARGADHPADPAATRPNPAQEDLATDAPVGGDIPGGSDVPDGSDVPGDSDVPGEHQHGTASGGGPECQWCPICQVVSRVRRTSPETVEQLAMAAASVLGSVRSLVEAAAESARQARADAEARSTQTAPAGGQEYTSRSARPGVDRIDVSEDPEPWD